MMNLDYSLLGAQVPNPSVIPQYAILSAVSAFTINHVITALFKQNQDNPFMQTVQKHDRVFSVIGGLVVAYIAPLPLVLIAVTAVFLVLQVMKKVEVETKPSLEPPQFLRNLTEEAKRSYTGFDAKLEELETCLHQTDMNNAILTGPPRVGKTAIAESLAYKIAHGKYSEGYFLANKTIFSLSVATIMSDTHLQGKLEEKIVTLLAFAKQNPNAIFFIDEIHGLIKTGCQKDSAVDLAYHLLTALARGEITVIGATTDDEYKIMAEQDPAFVERFTRLEIKPPDAPCCFTMLQHQIPYYKTSHKQKHDVEVEVLESALAASIFLTEKYDPTHCLPAKADNLIKKACSQAILSAPGQKNIKVDLEWIVKAFVSKVPGCSKDVLEEELTTYLLLNPEQFPGLVPLDLSTPWLSPDPSLIDATIPAEALFLQGLTYEKQDDLNQAMELYKKAAEAGFANALNQLGWRAIIDSDNGQAVDFFRKAAELGLAGGQCNLAYCYLCGIGVEPNAKQAFYWYKQAKELALCKLGTCYLNGIGVDKDENKGATLIKEAAEKGDAEAQDILGQLFESGIGVIADPTSAFYWHKRAALQGLSPAYCGLATCYLKGIGVIKNERIALALLQTAVKYGVAEAKFMLVGWYLEGIVVEKNEKRAFDLCLDAAESGIPEAQYDLANFYLDGTGCLKNRALANEWLEKAAKNGDPVAQTLLQELQTRN